MAISISSLGASYTQDFDTLASSGTSSALPAGWLLLETGSNANTTYAAGTGSSTTGNTYSFGSAGSSDRAFGTLLSGSLTPAIGASFSNDTAQTITSLTIAYSGEMWRAGVASRGAADRLDFQISFNATGLGNGSWTDVDALDLLSPQTSTSVGALDGNAAANRSALSFTLAELSLAPGATLWIRWADFNISSSDDGLAIDDFSIVAQGVAASPTVNLSVSRSDGSEGEGTVVTVTATSTAAVSGAQTVALAVTGSGITAADYLLSSATITIADGQTSGSVTFTVLDDVFFEGPETALLTISAPSAGLVLGGSVQQPVAIADNDTPPPVYIHDIQGAGHVSPRVGQGVHLVQGIVTAVAGNGFYLQDPMPDADPATSEGLFVFTGSGSPLLAARSVGEALRVSGTVQEFRPGGAGSNNLSVTELVNGAALALSVEAWSDAPALGIAATVLGVDAVPPTAVINDDFAVPTDVETGGDFEPALEGIDFWESLEGMLVQVRAPVAVSPTLSSGTADELWVLADDGAAASGRTARGGIAVSAGDFNPERLLLDDLDNATVFPLVDVGAKLADISGVIDYAGGNFELRVSAAPQVVQASPLAAEVTALSSGADWLRVATFNVENLDPSDPAAKFEALALAIVNHLLAPEIVSLEEVQDNNGAVNDSVVDASLTLQMLVDAIVVAGGPAYGWRQLDPADDSSGGEPGGNIRQVLLYDPARVTPVGAVTTLDDTDLGDGDAFASSRKPLVGSFEFNGETLTLIANHFTSKGGDDALFGRTQPPLLDSEAKRLQQAQVVADHVDALLTADATAKVLVAGDLNDFEFSPVLSLIEATGMASLIETLPAAERYTYNFQGNAQVLDHVLASGALLAGLAGVDIVHLNSEFASQVSDHDPVLARFFIERAGQVVNGTRGRDRLTGSDGADTIYGGAGRDTIVSGAGNDRIVYRSVVDGVDVLADFTPGTDRLVIDALLASVRYSGDDAVADGLLRVAPGSGKTTVLFDVDGFAGAGLPRPLVELAGVVVTDAALLLNPGLDG